jgi:hypothetical protein
VCASLHASAATPSRWISDNGHPQHVITALAGLAQVGKPLLSHGQSSAEYAPEPNPETKKRIVMPGALTARLIGIVAV